MPLSRHAKFNRIMLKIISFIKKVILLRIQNTLITLSSSLKKRCLNVIKIEDNHL